MGFVIHCKHGQHRTGIIMMLILRTLGCDKEESLRLIKSIRPTTFDELLKERKSKWFSIECLDNLVDFSELIFKYYRHMLCGDGTHDEYQKINICSEEQIH